MKKCLILYILMLYAASLCFIAAEIMIVCELPENRYGAVVWSAIGLYGIALVLGVLTVLWDIWLILHPDRLDFNRLNYRTVMLAKLVMIPWFICNFLQCVLFTIGLSFFVISLLIVIPLFIIFTYMAILPASVLSTALYVAGIRRGQKRIKELLLWHILEYVFVLDVAASVILYAKCGKSGDLPALADATV